MHFRTLLTSGLMLYKYQNGQIKKALKSLYQIILSYFCSPNIESSFLSARNLQ